MNQRVRSQVGHKKANLLFQRRTYSQGTLRGKNGWISESSEFTFSISNKQNKTLDAYLNLLQITWVYKTEHVQLPRIPALLGDCWSFYVSSKQNYSNLSLSGDFSGPSFWSETRNQRYSFQFNCKRSVHNILLS